MNTIILNNEIDFRNYLISNKDDIIKIYIFEDNLDNYIYFYAFLTNEVIATKEKGSFENYYILYKTLNNFNIEESNKTLKLFKN